MGVGESSREVHIATDRATAFNAAFRAAEAVGKVREWNETMGTLTVRTRYGLQAIKLRISVVPDDHGTRIVIGAFGDDIWGGGARKGTDKFLRALEDVFA